MKRIGFVTSSSVSTSTYRGMDAYAKHLLEHLKKNSQDSGFSVEEITDLKSVSISNFDLFHFPIFSLYFPNIPPYLTKPFVVTVHDVTRLEFPSKYPPGVKGRLRLEYQKLVLARSRAVITDSYSSVNQIRKYLHIPHTKIKLVYLAAGDNFRRLTVSDSKNVVKKYNLPNKFVLVNGEIDWNKNLAGLIQACSTIKASLVLYGKSSKNLFDHPEKFDNNSAELSHIEGLKELLHRPNVYVLGFVPDADLVKIFNVASVYAQPSFAEGFGIPVLEAMACGAPVACSRTHSLPEVAGDSAVYFDPYNVNDVASKISKILKDATFSRQMINSGYQQVKKFSWDKAARETLMVYREVLDQL